MVYCGLPFAALAGVAIAAWNRNFILTAELGSLRSPYDFEYRVTTYVNEAILATFKATMRPEPTAGAAAADSGANAEDGGGGGAGGDDTPYGHDAGSMFGSPPPVSTGGRGRRANNSTQHRRFSGSPYSSNSRYLNRDAPFGGRAIVGHSTSEPDCDDFGDMSDSQRLQGGSADSDLEGQAAATFKVADSEQRADVARQRLSPDVIRAAEKMWSAAAARFPSSAMLHAMQARFASTFRGLNDRDGKRETAAHYLQASRLSPSLFVEFQAFAWRQLTDGQQTGNGELPLMKRLAFDKALLEARRSSVATINALIRIWTELQNETRPDLALLQGAAALFAKSCHQADDGFSRALSINPQSISALRLSSTFHAVCLNNRDKATALAAEADRLEEARSKEVTSAAGNQSGFSFKLWSETAPDMSDAAILKIGSSSRDLGIICSASAAACRAFGYSKNQLERRSLSVLMPSPIGEIFLNRLTAFFSGDSSVRLTDTTRSLFGKSKSGAIFPIAMLIRESLDQGAGDDAEEHGGPSLMAMVRPLMTSESFMLIDSRLNIIAADSRSLTLLLNTDAASLSTGEFNLSECVQDFDASFEELQRPTGALITFCLGQQTPALTNGDDDAQRSPDGTQQQQQHRGSGRGGLPPIKTHHGSHSSSGEQEATALQHRTASFRASVAAAVSYRLRARLQLLRHKPQLAVLSWRLGGSNRGSMERLGGLARRSSMRRDSLNTHVSIMERMQAPAGTQSEGDHHAFGGNNKRTAAQAGGSSSGGGTGGVHFSDQPGSGEGRKHQQPTIIKSNQSSSPSGDSPALEPSHSAQSLRQVNLDSECEDGSLSPSSQSSDEAEGEGEKRGPGGNSRVSGKSGGIKGTYRLDDIMGVGGRSGGATTGSSKKDEPLDRPTGARAPRLMMDGPPQSSRRQSFNSGGGLDNVPTRKGSARSMDDDGHSESSHSVHSSNSRFSTKTLNKFRRVMEARGKKPSGVITSR